MKTYIHANPQASFRKAENNSGFTHAALHGPFVIMVRTRTNLRTTFKLPEDHQNKIRSCETNVTHTQENPLFFNKISGVKAVVIRPKYLLVSSGVINAVISNL